MKLAAIYNIWDGVELLRGSIEQIKKDVDFFIFVVQDVSNFGEAYDPRPDLNLPDDIERVIINFDPLHQAGFPNECAKRNLGLSIAKKFACTHFLHLDCDEYYEDFHSAKQKYIESGAIGSVCKILTYFKKPTWRFDTEDGYYVPFIHQLSPNTVAGTGKYPFYVDPTRKINEQNIILLDVYMHHYSWIRLDIERKARNSSAKFNLEKGTMVQDYHSPECKPGFYVKDYDKKLIEVPNYFNIQLVN